MSCAGCRVYLAGPMSGCNPRQQKVWRDQFKNLFGASYDFEDPTEWVGKWAPSREVLAIDGCDVVVANMWKESIGTTFGMIHARASGKPVVVIDSNHIESSILTAIVDPEPVHDLKTAASRVKQIATSLKQSFKVEKKDGSRVRFSQPQLARSIKAACVAAKVDDVMLPMQVFPATLSKLRSVVRDGVVMRTDIKDAVHGALEDVAGSPIYPKEVRAAALRFKAAWKEREDAKDIDELFDQLTAENERLKLELKGYRDNVRAMMAHTAVVGPPAPETTPEVSTVEEAVRLAEEKFAAFLVILPSARKSARESAYANPGKAFDALNMLARCAQERICAKGKSEKPVGMKEWFGRNRDRLPALKYKANESKMTMGLYGDERTFPYKGRRLVMPKHLSIGAGGVDSTLRIHFEVDEESQMVVVGHVGKHLRNMTS